MTVEIGGVSRRMEPDGAQRSRGCSWGTLRIPFGEDWGTLGNIRESPPLGPPGTLNNPIILGRFPFFWGWFFGGPIFRGVVKNPEN